jgi:LPS export ABC transporter protein LptC
VNKYHSSKLFQFITLVVISSLCLLLDKLTKIHFSQANLPKNAPEYTAYGADGNVFNQSGKLLYRVVSDRAWKYPNDPKVYLQKVKIYFYAKKTDAIAYQISGDDGFIDEENKQGELGKNVVVTMNSDNLNAPITFYGNQVDIKVVQAKSVVTAHGFSYDSEQQFLTLNSKVRVYYAK